MSTDSFEEDRMVHRGHGMGRFSLFMGALLFLVLTSCSSTRTQRIGLPESSDAARSVVATIRVQVEGELLQHVGVNQAAVVTTLTGPETFPAHFKQTVVLQTLAEGLNQELELPFVGDMTHLDEDSIEREIEAVLNNAETKMEPLRVRWKHLEARTMNNLSLVRY